MRRRPAAAGLLAAGWLLAACSSDTAVTGPTPFPRFSVSTGALAGTCTGTPPAGERFAVTCTAATIPVGDTLSFTTSDGPASWRVADTTVARVNAAGLVVAVRGGATTLTATMTRSPYSTATATLTVVESLVIEEAPAPVAAPVDSAAAGAAPTDTLRAPTSPVDTTATRPTWTSASTAELPRVTVDTRMPVVTGRSIAVGPGASLQAALDAAQPGDEVVLDAGATFVGNFRLPAKSGAMPGRWIVVRSGGTLPAPGTRARPSDAAQMAKLLTANAAPVLATEAGAVGWRLVGLELGAVPANTMVYNLVALGEGSGTLQTSAAQLPSHLVVDRSYIHGHPQLHVRRCVGLNSATTAIIDSWLSECHSNHGDSQAIYGWNGPGPFAIENNHIEGGHEGFGFGGPTPGIVGLIPSDITIRRNHVIRPASWRGVWTAKNLFEMKSGQRVLFEGNVLENNWMDAQPGFAILLQGLSDDNDAPQNRIWDVTIRHNVIRNSAGGINLASRVAYGGPLPTEPMTRVTVENNSFALNSALSGGWRGLQILGDVQQLLATRNSFLDVQGAPMSVAVLFDNSFSTLARGVRIVGNVFGPTEYWAVSGNGTSGALTTFARYAPDAVFSGNVVVGDANTQYPAGNHFPSTLLDAGIGGFSTGALQLVGAPTYLAGVTQAPGIDAAAIAAATAGVVQ